MGGSAAPKASLIITIRDEADSLSVLMESICRQTLLPAEVIVVDGGSTDNSLEILEQWKDRMPLEVTIALGVGISEGRNIGIHRSTSEFIAVTDAGVRLDSQWLEQLVSPLTQCVLPVDVVAGFFEPDAVNDFEVALAASTLPDVGEIDPETFLPSSRSIAFRKSWFEAGVRYPEWLDYCEDLIFDLRLKRAGARFVFQPKAIARFRPRSNVSAFWRQYYLYARGDGKAGLFWKRHLVRYVTYLLVLPSFFAVQSPIWRAVVLIGGLTYMRSPVMRLWRRSGGNVGAVVKLAPLAVFLRAVGDVAKMVGYPVGLLWRARRYGLRRDWRSISEVPDQQSGSS